ncbi:MAG: hypothetical protein ACK521_10325 [bacterium]
MDQKKKQTDNFYIDRIDNALASEEFNKMQNMLEPLSLVSFNFKFHIFPRTEAE